MTTKNQLLKTIRKQCIECMGFQEREVEICTAPKCSLFPYRMGKDPSPNASMVERCRKNLGKRPTDYGKEAKNGRTDQGAYPEHSESIGQKG